jgi:quinol monooxygenase YgiN
MDALKILIDLPQPVSGLFLNPPAAQACFARPLSIGPTRKAASGGTVSMVLFLDVFPPGLIPTLAAVKEAAVAARKGEGNLRYDIEQEGVGLGNHMVFYAAWQNRDDFDAYEKSDYARHLRDVVGPLLGSPYDDRLYALID